MIQKQIYRYEREDGGITVSPKKPLDGVSYQIRWRLIADEGKAITNGLQIVTVIDLVHRKDCEQWRDCGLPKYMKQPSLSPPADLP